MSKTTILMFDSGVGGLSVFQDIKAKMPNLSCTYIFDNQAYPYGELPQEELISRTCQYVSQFVESHNIDLVVIACNTASTVVLPKLRQLLSIPVVGVVPAIKPASQRANIGVGLIATPATITREYTHDLIKDFAADKDVKLLGSTTLVDMAEKKLRKSLVDLEQLAKVLEPLNGYIDVAVLGCTHFPLLKEEIQQVMGADVVLVDSGEAIARRVEFLLQDKIKADDQHPLYRVYCSAEIEYKEALQVSLTEMGFGSLKIQPLKGA
ncbi:glutamate racemase [Vibrio ishigakensis]|nr:glutamate racemase [Vibrio ishigakensis]